MKKSPDQFGASLRENFIPILPAIVAAMINLVMLIGSAILMQPNMGGSQRLTLVIFGVVGCAYIGLYYWAYTALPEKPGYAWINAVIAGGALGLLIRFIPAEIDYLVHALLVISALSSSVISERAPSYAMIAIVAALHMTHHTPTGSPPVTWIIHGMLYVAALIVVETIQQVKALATKQMARIEAVNEISKQIVSTLETKQLISLLDAALQNALDADSYYIGLLRNNELHMRLFYDEGEYFNDVRFNLEGTLSGWVINHQKALFLPDLRKPLKLEGINVVTIGKSKASLSWMGVPMKGTHVNGIIAIASYKPKAFDRSDFELLSSIAQRAALALDNTYHHAQVQEQARLDSLTRVLNHSRFIETLREQAETCLALRQPLSLIMLDIDHFKQYNDSFGHPVGDEILVNLCRIIREHIKQTDAVGRWGGEEFAVSLPNSDGQQTLQVAQRIRSTLAGFEINNDRHIPIPAPTISMGIAVFPAETNDVTKLIDIADRRLYIAKRRGRDQIESAG